MNDINIIQTLRANLQPKGTAPIVRLQLTKQYFNAEFVDQCISELENMYVRSTLGDPPSNLERLAYALLCDSAYIDPGRPITQSADSTC